MLKFGNPIKAKPLYNHVAPLKGWWQEAAASPGAVTWPSPPDAAVIAKRHYIERQRTLVARHQQPKAADMVDYLLHMSFDASAPWLFGPREQRS
jgi:hypothetical protein